MAKFPEDFERQIREIQIDSSKFLRFIPGLIVVIVALVLLSTSWVTIGPEERGVVLRLGKYSSTFDPGLHFKIPFGVDRVYKVPVQRQLKAEFGFQTAQPGVRTVYESRDFSHESLMLTGDLNVADVEWVTQFRIKEPQKFLFKVKDVPGTFRLMNEAVMREAMGDRTINEILTYGRRNIELLVKDNLQSLCDQYEMGLTIDQVILQDVNVPDPVKPAFNEVNRAQQEKETMINQAMQEYNKVVPRAEGDAEKMVEESKGYAVERVNRAKGMAERFNSIFSEYVKAPEVTRQRIYLETMDKVQQKAGKKIIIDDEVQGILPMLNLNQEVIKP